MTDQHSLLPAPTDPPAITCKKCKVPLPDATWKNCDNCRRNRTESYNRWKKSAQLRKANAAAGSQTGKVDLNSSTSLHAPANTAPTAHHSNGPKHHRDPLGSLRLADDQQRPTSASIDSLAAGAIEYQWSDELIDALLALPPRSRYIGKFSIIADPAVDNSMRAHVFADQLRARAVPISKHSQPMALSADSNNSYAIVSFCTCQERCRGRFAVSVDDDLSHPYGVPGQCIVVVVVHSSPPD